MALLYCVLMCFGIFLLAMIYFLVKRGGYAASFFTGTAVFVITQLVIRLPILQYVLPKTGWFLIMTATKPVLTAFFYAVTAGIFEECGRYAGFRIFRRGRVSWLDGVAFGLGHGGIEAVWVGVSVFANLGLATPMNLAVAGFERMCTIAIQTGLSLIVLEAVRKKKLRWLLAAVLLHTLVDLPVGLVRNVWLIEGYLLVLATGLLIYTMRQRKRRKVV